MSLETESEKREYLCRVEIASGEVTLTFEDNEGYSYDRYGVRFNHNKTKLIEGVSGLKTYRIPDSVIEIGEKAFYFPEATDMEFIIPEGVKIIGDSAFFLSPNGIDLPQSITTLGCSPFCCSFTIGKNVSEIAEGVSMYDDPIYVDPENPNFVIYDDALYSKDMKRLLHVFTKKKEYVIPDGVERVDMWAFCGAWHIRSIHIPSSVRYIGCGALPDELECISVSPDNPNFCVVNGALFGKVY